jgi:predicted Zn-dependent peptidase
MFRAARQVPPPLAFTTPFRLISVTVTAAFLTHLALWASTAASPALAQTAQRPAAKPSAAQQRTPAAPPKPAAQSGTRAAPKAARTAARTKAATARTPRPIPALTTARPTAAAAPVAAADPALLALDRALPAAGGRVAAYQLVTAGDSAFAHLGLRFGDPIALSGRTPEVAVLRQALSTRLGQRPGTALLGATDPWQLGTDTPGALAVELASTANDIGMTVRTVVEQLRASLSDQEIATAIDQLTRGVLDRRRDATAAVFAEASRVAQPYPTDHPRHVPELRALPSWYTRVRAADVRQLHERLQRGEFRAAVVTGTDADRAKRDVERAMADWSPSAVTRVPEMFTPPQDDRRTVLVDDAGWTGMALVQSVPIRLDDPDWLPLRLSAWILGGSPTARRFAPAPPSVLGGGAAFDAAMSDRAAVYVVWAAASPDAVRSVEQQWRALLAAALRDGFSDAEVRAAAAEWLAARQASRESPRALARQLVARLDAGQTFAGWDGAIEARARTLSGRAVSDAMRRQLDPARFALVVAGLPAAMP